MAIDEYIYCIAGRSRNYSGERMAGCTEITVNVHVYTKQYNLRLNLPPVFFNNYILYFPSQAARPLRLSILYRPMFRFLPIFPVVTRYSTFLFSGQRKVSFPECAQDLPFIVSCYLHYFSFLSTVL